MRVWWAFVLCLWACAVSAGDPQIDAVKSMIQRYLPVHISNYFYLEKVAGNSTLDFFSIESIGPYILLRGPNAVSLASAFHYYIENFCHFQISWGADQLGNGTFPLPLPPVPQRVVRGTWAQWRCVGDCGMRSFWHPIIIRSVLRRYYENVCTVSYSNAFWNWSRWEREIDWMAMSGWLLCRGPVRPLRH